MQWFLPKHLFVVVKNWKLGKLATERWLSYMHMTENYGATKNYDCQKKILEDVPNCLQLGLLSENKMQRRSSSSIPHTLTLLALLGKSSFNKGKNSNDTKLCWKYTPPPQKGFTVVSTTIFKKHQVKHVTLMSMVACKWEPYGFILSFFAKFLQ